MTTQITLQPKYTLTLYQRQVSFQGKAIVVDPLDKYIAFYPFAAHLKENKYISSIMNTESKMISFSPG